MYVDNYITYTTHVMNFNFYNTINYLIEKKNE